MTIECLICKSRDCVLIFDKDGRDFYKCGECGLVFIWPQPKQTDNKNMYDTWGDNYYLSREKIQIDYSASFDERLNIIEPYRKNNRLLDVGCSIGAFLSAARGRGWEEHGVELSRPSAAYAKDEKGLNVICGTLEEARYEDDHFDVVNIWAVLEHVTDPVGILKEARRILREGGALVFCVPNYRCLPIRIIGKRYRYICDGHLFYFNKKNIQRLMKDLGYAIKDLSSEYFSPVTFIEDLKGSKPENLKTAVLERGVEKKIKDKKALAFVLRPLWRILRFFILKLYLGEELRVIAVKKSTSTNP